MSESWKPIPTRAPVVAPVVAAPALIETRYDRWTSFLLSLVFVTLLVVAWLSAVWLTNRIRDIPFSSTIELIEIAGGDPGGVEGAIQQVDGRQHQDVEDMSVIDRPNDQVQIENQITQWLDALAELPMEILDQQEALDKDSYGKAGNQSGNSTQRGLGEGGAGKGLPREQRWVILYSSGQSLAEYAQLLDYFKIELGAIVDGRVVYVSQVSTDSPRQRTRLPGEDRRIRWLWRGGQRRQTDASLLKSVGLPIDESTIIMQFLPPEIESRLVQLERTYMDVSVQDIQRTAFGIRSGDEGFSFYVIEQEYF